MINALELKSSLRALVPALLVCYMPLTAFSQSVCNCKKAGSDEWTRPGANELITIIERQPRKSVLGQVSDATGQPLKDVLAEVFAVPTRGKAKRERRRIIACTTDEKGRFCFRKIPAGRYEVLFSLDGGWKHTSLTLLVAPNSGKSVSRKIDVWLEVGS